jgi:RNA polymerase sigma factor (sigma-70 family)
MIPEGLGVTYFNTLRDMMFRFAVSIVSDKDSAEDAVQDVFVKILLLSEQNRYKNLEAFAMTSVRNKCYDMLRHSKFRSDEPVDIGIPVEDHNDWDVRIVIRKAIDSLPRKQREVVHLKDVEGYEIKEIAEILSMRENVVRVVLSRARKELRQKIEKMMNYGTK